MFFRQKVIGRTKNFPMTTYKRYAPSEKSEHNIGTFTEIVKHKHLIFLFSLPSKTWFKAARTAYTIENNYE